MSSCNCVNDRTMGSNDCKCLALLPMVMPLCIHNILVIGDLACHKRNIHSWLAALRRLDLHISDGLRLYLRNPVNFLEFGQEFRFRCKSSFFPRSKVFQRDRHHEFLFQRQRFQRQSYVSEMSEIILGASKIDSSEKSGHASRSAS